MEGVDLIFIIGVILVAPSLGIFGAMLGYIAILFALFLIFKNHKKGDGGDGK